MAVAVQNCKTFILGGGDCKFLEMFVFSRGGGRAMDVQYISV